MGERFELDVAALRTVTAGFVTSAAALDATADALRGRDERLARPVLAWAEATRSNARRLEAAIAGYVRQEQENARAVGGAQR